MKDFIKVFSNIGSYIVEYVELCNEERKKAEEKRKEAEREKLEAENERIYGYKWPNEWMKKHKQDYLDGKITRYHYDSGFYSDSYYHSDYCAIYFYEWSSMDGNQHKFYSYSNFYRYCDDNGIKVSDSDKETMRGYSVVYATCIPGKNELMMASTSYGLQSLLDVFNEKEKAK